MIVSRGDLKVQVPKKRTASIAWIRKAKPGAALALFGLLGSFFALAAASNGAASGSTVSTRTFRGALRLSIFVARVRYPRDALILVRVRVKNVSKTSTSLQTVCEPGLAPYLPIFARVLDSSGRTLFPPALGGEQGQACPPASRISLGPGRTVTRRQYVVLRAPRVQAVIHVPTHAGASNDVTASVGVSLGPRDRPQLVVSANPDLFAQVRPAVPGPLVYKQWVRCTSQNGQSGSAEGSGWVRTSRTRIAPLCIQPVQWQVVVGQVNHSVAEFDYTPD
jgi:hypothetical protein